jgi:type 1 glutamine amidotransferase
MNFYKMKLSTKILSLFLIAGSLFLSQCKEPASLSALIVSDSAPMVSGVLKGILMNSGLFDVDIQKGKSYDFADYDVVVLELENAEWPDEVKKELVTYVSGGGGLVVLGSTSGSFKDWPEAEKIFGVRSDKQLSKSKNAHDYLIVNSSAEHPVINGLQKKWMHVNDYMMYNTQAISDNVEVLASSKADTVQGGNGKMLPVMFTHAYVEGRVFNSTLGYAATKDYIDVIQCVGFITTFQRGAEWAATGVVSQEAPIDFPNSVSTHLWPSLKAPTLDEILEKSSVYQIGKSKQYLSDFSMRLRNSDGKPETYAMFESKMLELLASDATVDSKKYMCRELSWMGSEKSIPALEKLVDDKDLSESATYALQRLRK